VTVTEQLSKLPREVVKSPSLETWLDMTPRTPL